ncbi:hypothetical protein V8E51_017553 [Hyaloscypha variabilis]
MADALRDVDMWEENHMDYQMVIITARWQKHLIENHLQEDEFVGYKYQMTSGHGGAEIPWLASQLDLEQQGFSGSLLSEHSGDSYTAPRTSMTNVSRHLCNMTFTSPANAFTSPEKFGKCLHKPGQARQPLSCSQVRISSANAFTNPDKPGKRFHKLGKARQMLSAHGPKFPLASPYSGIVHHHPVPAAMLLAEATTNPRQLTTRPVVERWLGIGMRKRRYSFPRILFHTGKENLETKVNSGKEKFERGKSKLHTKIEHHKVAFQKRKVKVEAKLKDGKKAVGKKWKSEIQKFTPELLARTAVIEDPEDFCRGLGSYHRGPPLLFKRQFLLPTNQREEVRDDNSEEMPAPKAYSSPRLVSNQVFHHQGVISFCSFRPFPRCIDCIKRNYFEFKSHHRHVSRSAPLPAPSPYLSQPSMRQQTYRARALAVSSASTPSPLPTGISRFGIFIDDVGERVECLSPNYKSYAGQSLSPTGLSQPEFGRPIGHPPFAGNMHNGSASHGPSHDFDSCSKARFFTRFLRVLVHQSSTSLRSGESFPLGKFFLRLEVQDTSRFLCRYSIYYASPKFQLVMLAVLVRLWRLPPKRLNTLRIWTSSLSCWTFFTPMVAGSTHEYQDFCLISDEIRLWFVAKLRRYRSYAASHLPEPSDGLDDGDYQRNDSFDVLRVRLLVDNKYIPTAGVAYQIISLRPPRRAYVIQLDPLRNLEYRIHKLARLPQRMSTFQQSQDPVVHK